ncbi:transposase domain-containing protein [Vibrio sp. Isolate23]|uniref:transposase domain-containing protein n=1 Tax=Vibrio sp. Isolate23 TaxID=2908533 RepID=UPI001EFCBCDA|nr:transposase domain-containing protein [Vibrio sp. Isolate23]MCG9685239.1 transposase domain-containing protein [Vibrio sp. Isolate23]
MAIDISRRTLADWRQGAEILECVWTHLRSYLLKESARGAPSSCILYSLVEAAKANGLAPAEYLTHCFERLAVEPDNIEALMPWNIKGLKSAK